VKPVAGPDDFRCHVSEWSHFANLVEHFSHHNGHDWLFRGVTEQWHSLVPKIGRPVTRKLKAEEHVPYRYEDELAVLAMFKQQARAHLASAPGSPLEWLAIAQHWGLPTRFLDWTDSLAVAAWFAVEACGAKSYDSPHSAIWVTRGAAFIPWDFYHEDPFLLGGAMTYRPPHITPRIAAQGSVLMICPNPTDEVKLPFAKQIVIDREFEFTLQKRLNACGINRRQLFPDLSGLSDHLAWMYKNDWLAGYKNDWMDRR